MAELVAVVAAVVELLCLERSVCGQNCRAGNCKAVCRWQHSSARLGWMERTLRTHSETSVRAAELSPPASHNTLKAVPTLIQSSATCVSGAGDTFIFSYILST